MAKILFINSCPREKGVSRTLALADAFFEEYRKNHLDDEIQVKNLYEENIHCYSVDEITKRDTLIGKKAFENEMFASAREFAAADKIVIAAPYWDLSFPAILKAYIEAVCVNGITFHYTAKGAEGLAVFDKLLYLTTSGGYPGKKQLGRDYVQGICEFLGHGIFLFCSAEGLDIQGNDVSGILAEVREKVQKIAQTF